jgi:putative MATE family efflux protein
MLLSKSIANTKPESVKSYSIVDSPTNFRPMARLAMPALAEEMLVLLVTWTDWWLAGHFFQADGDATKAAMGLMAYVMWLIPSMFSVVAIGATALIARWVGMGDVDRARLGCNQAFLVGALFAGILTTLMAVFGDEFIHLMQLKGDAADFAYQYLFIITPLIPLVAISQVGSACLRGAGDTVTGFVAKLAVVIVNIIVSTMLVTGWGPFEAIGWQGIAIGTATGYAVGGTIILLTLINGRAGLKLQWKWLKPNFEIIGKMFKIGLPAGFDVGTLLFCNLTFLAIINSLGKASAAAHGLTIQIEACAFLPGAAFQVAAATIAGQFLGAGMPDRSLRGALLCLYTGMSIMVVSGVMLFFYGENIANFFTGQQGDPTTVLVGELLKIVAFVMPSLAIVMILSGAFRGAGDTVWPFAFTAFGFFLIRIPLAAYFALDDLSLIGFESVECLGWGVKGAWYAMVADLVIRSLMIGHRFFYGGWRSVKI